MGRARDPNREKAYEIYADHNGKITNRKIAEMLSLPEKTISGWKCKDKWDEKLNGVLQKNERSTPRNMEYSKKNTEYSNPSKKRGPPLGNKNAVGHGAPVGSKNALGNKGGHGGPPGNKKAVITGEYETIWLDCLTDEEQDLCQGMNTDTLVQVNEDIRLLTVRERRMLQRIKNITDGLTEKELKVLQERINEKVPIEVVHEVTGEKKIVNVTNTKMVTTEITETEFRKIDDILKIEEALTRVQEKKTRLLTLKHSIESANKGNEGTAAAQEHAKRLREAWANR